MNRELICDMIWHSATRAPDKEAFRCNGAGHTYAQLASRAGRLARLLADSGVKKGDRVGVFMPKSLHASTALYGILAAGAAYVPIDPRSPSERIARIVANAEIRFVVSEQSRAKQLERAFDRTNDLTVATRAVTVSVALLDASPEDLVERGGEIEWFGAADVDSAPDTDPIDALGPHDLAYIMYTSGSTGEPKGIMHTHGSGYSYASASAALYGVRADDRLSNHSPLHFDMSTFDYFTGPLAGATTIVVPEQYSVLPASMSQLVQDERMSIWYSVPLALIQMLTRGVLDQRDLSSLRWVLFGGEPFPPRHLQKLMRRLPHTRFSNVYGPAEVNQCTYYHVPASYAEGPATTSVPLGTMWPAAKGLVVDSNDQAVEVGREGELLVATPTMMNGYWKRPDLNARAFVEVTSNDAKPARYYRTGDIVRKREDGLMDFVGRADRQVKVRGYRIELDEIERALVAHPQITEAAALVVEGTEETNEICVAILSDAVAAPTDREVLKHLRSLLPTYALPATIVALDGFPRTGSGKVDRNALKELVALNTTPEEQRA